MLHPIMDRAAIIELSIGIGAIVLGILLALYIRKVKERLKKFVLRNHEN